MIKVKVCGITNYSDAAFSIKSGASFLGFIFYRKSSRYITPKRAKKIIDKLPKGIFKVGVFVNEEEWRVKEIAGLCGLDLLQFHGDESDSYLESFKKYKTIKVLRVKDKLALKDLEPYKADYFLFDTYSRDSFGGTGKVFDWSNLEALKKIKSKFFISGGLTPSNVGELVKKFHPFAVDVSSGVEKSKGKKDSLLIKSFIDAVKKGNKNDH